jgi:hypothetical protein
MDKLIKNNSMDRREFLIRVGGGTAALGMLALFPSLVSGCNSSDNKEETISVVVTYSILGQ